MLARLVYLRDRLRSSFWLVPAAMALVAIVTAVCMLWVDQSPLGVAVNDWSTPYAVGAAGARLVLSTIAGSMITVASLVFSMTLVALTLAASSIGARLLDSYIANRVNQIALGLFLSTFVYSLIILRAVHDGSDAIFVPHLSVSLAMIFAILSFGWLIYFIHDLATSIQVDNAVARIGGDLARSVEALPDPEGSQPSWPGARGLAIPDERSFAETTVPVGTSGYMQTIDAGKLVELALEHDVIIELHQRPGDFAIPSSVLAGIAGSRDVDDELAEAIRSNIVYGPKRTPAQDLLFSVRLLVEVAARALSPGINDFYTAIACIDHLTASLATVLNKGLPSGHRADAEGRLRVVLSPLTFEDLADTAFNPIRQSAGGIVAVLVRLLESLTALTADCRHPAEYACIEEHAERIRVSARRQIEDDADFEMVAAQHARLKEALRVRRGS